MTKILYATDPHNKGRNPGSRLDDFPDVSHKKMLELEQVCLFEEPDALVLGGDIYDTPRVALSLIIQNAKIYKRIRRMGIPIFIVPGNHDLYGYSMSTIDQTAIGVLAETGLVKLLTQDRSFLIKDKAGKNAVEIFGREYDKDLDILPKNDYQITPKHKSKHKALFAHGMLLQKPFHPDVRHSLTKDVETDADVVMCGHYHEGYPLHEENGTLFGNPGSTGRDEICKRQPQYAIMEFTKSGIDVNYVEYASAPHYNDIFDFSAKVTAKTYERYLDSFEQTLQDAMTFDAYDAKDVLAKLTTGGNVEQEIIDAAMDAIVAAEMVNHDGKLDGYIEKRKPQSIVSVEATNFQSHAHTFVEFDPYGVNAITGPSDSGKTGIIRIIKWVVQNEPKGADFIRTGETRVTGTVRFSDGSSITRTRTRTDSGSYIVRDPSGKETEFKGFGTSVPIDVANIHQMPKVELAPGLERSLNFTNQLDGHFLLTESAGTRAAVIGRLTGVHNVDAAIKEKKRELTNLTKDINESAGRVEALDERLAGYSDLDDLENNINIVSLMITAAEKAQQEIDELVTAQEDIKVNQQRVEDLEDVLQDYADVDKAVKLIAQVELKGKELNELIEHDQELGKTTKLIKSYTSRLASYGDIKATEKLIDQAEKGVNDLRDLETLYSDLIEADGMVIMYDKQLQEYGDMLAAAEKVEHAEALIADLKELEQLSLSLSIANDDIAIIQNNITHQAEKETMARARMKAIFDELGNKCPMCQNDLDEEHMEHVVDAV